MKTLLFSITRKDFNISYFSGTGAGGQHRNKHQNCVRMKHRDSGVSATGQSNKSRKRNETEAFRGIINNEKFILWSKRETAMRLHEGISIDEKIKQMMRPENLKVEYL